MSITATKEKPIPFSSQMVRAILAGAKTQTRRIIKPLPSVTGLGDAAWYDKKADLWRNVAQFSRDCGPYSVGDRLWVRETFRPFILAHGKHKKMNQRGIQYKAGGTVFCDDLPGSEPDDFFLNVTEVCKPTGHEFDADYDEFEHVKFRPSIFMPRWASRITLEITDVKVERLQEISEADARAEGVDAIPDAPAQFTRRGAFIGLWDKINGKTHPWSANDYVWVWSFKRLEGTP